LSVTIPASGAYPPIIGVPSGNIGGSDSVTTPSEPVVSAPPPFIDYPASVDTEKAAPDGANQQKIAEIRDNSVSKSGRRKEDGAEVIRTVRGAPPPTVLAKSTILPTKATKAKSVLDVRTAENRWRSKPDNYTVQIASSHGVVAIKTLAEKLPSEQPHFIYLASRDGKPWYVLIYGSFGSKVEANSARAALVAKIDTGSSPWVRRQGEIFVH
jgi:DamX protein